MKLTDLEIEQALERCAAEPIHQIGCIQPHGALLAPSLDNRRIVLQASENLADFIDLDDADLIGRPLAALIGEVAARQVDALLDLALQQRAASGKLQITRQNQTLTLQALVSVNSGAGVFLLELTKVLVSHQEQRLAELLLEFQQNLVLADGGSEMERYFALAARLVRTLSGYDNVMVYRFDAEWNGEVITQDKIETAPAYLGLHFPASDIPVQARRLYTLNLARLIADIEAEPVAVSPALNPVTHGPLDMTYSALRSVSPVHIQYLRNIGVRATMTISLLQQGRLWGLIACHHFSPKPVSFSLREAVTFIGRMVSAKLTELETREQYLITANANLLIGELLKYGSREPQSNVLRRFLPKLMQLVAATGIIVLVEGQTYVAGEAPGAEEIEALLAWLAARVSPDIFSTSYLSQSFPAAAAYKQTAAGLMATQVIGSTNNCIIWLRGEMPTMVNWAGKTEKDYVKVLAGGYRLTPRSSFEIWTEAWLGRSAPWTEAEQSVARMLSLVLPEYFAQKSRQEKTNADIRIAAAAFDTREAVMMTDADGVILRVNAGFTGITGFSSAEAVGRKPNLLRSGRHDNDFYAAMWRRLIEDGAWEGEIWNRHKDGAVFLERLSITAVKTQEDSSLNYVATFYDITSERQASEEMQRLAFYDPLTGLPNRRLLNEKLKAVFAANARHGQCAALLFIDLDNFKLINDTLGHDAGDELLREAALRLLACVRETDTVARIGGDEFVVILTELSGDGPGVAQTEQVARKILAALAQPYRLGDHPCRNTPSIGAVLLRGPGMDINDLLRQADTAMYQAKRAGRNTVRFFEP